MPFPRNHSSYGTHNDHDTRPQPPLHFHTLPKGHGPASSSSRISTAYSLSSLEHAPAFVRAVGEYDELGRRVVDSVGNVVSEGRGGKRKGGQGDALTFWKALELAPRSAVPSADSITLPTRDSNAAAGSSESPSNAATRLPIQPFPQKTTDTAPLRRPLVVPREQWFIRKALLAKAQREQESLATAGAGGSNKDQSPGSSSPSAGAGSPSVAGSRAGTPSLASLLSSSLPPPPSGGGLGINDEHLPIEAFQPPAYFHLKPNNKGWQVLRKIGWDESGGLGRSATPGSVGGVDEQDRPAGRLKREGGLENSTVSRNAAGGKHGKGKEKAKDGVIDLTLDSASDSDSASESEKSSNDTPSVHEKFGQDIIGASNTNDESNRSSSSRIHGAGSGPGRTAPVATYFKTDMRGIGALSASEQKRNLLRPSSLSASGSSTSTAAATACKRKRVTHTNEEIRAVARERKGTGEGLIGLERVAWDMKKAKRDGKVDREERRKWREIINM
ncbi:hypothetical protein QFC22_001256 [Naganishia vaughanmartiniae]|uniref:Uncharacterized protein n=1 Tax=Naganishia vaughanmartiniae TaxID=1424756 RepID=A0ACC2XGM6_9TREE|nr:hypothetical protein QFC22_001256 [Naganishia vaughanmartiniae]